MSVKQLARVVEQDGLFPQKRPKSVGTGVHHLWVGSAVHAKCPCTNKESVESRFFREECTNLSQVFHLSILVL